MVQAFSTVTIRPERSEDASRVRHVNELAFGQPMEADLVERLRQTCTDSLSLVAEDDAVVGHILFTPVVIESAERRVLGMGLAPMAVLPGRQRQGSGSRGEGRAPSSSAAVRWWSSAGRPRHIR